MADERSPRELQTIDITTTSGYNLRLKRPSSSPAVQRIAELQHSQVFLTRVLLGDGKSRGLTSFGTAFISRDSHDGFF